MFGSRDGRLVAWSLPNRASNPSWSWLGDRPPPGLAGKINRSAARDSYLLYRDQIICFNSNTSNQWFSIFTHEKFVISLFHYFTRRVKFSVSSKKYNISNFSFFARVRVRDVTMYLFIIYDFNSLHSSKIILPSIRALYFRSTILHYLGKVLLLFLNIKMRILQCKNIQYVFVNQKINLIATRHGSKMGGEKSRSRRCSNKSRAEEPSISRIIRVKIHRPPFLAPPRRERVC